MLCSCIFTPEVQWCYRSYWHLQLQKLGETLHVELRTLLLSFWIQMFNKINIKLDDSHNVCNGHLQILWLLNRLISEAKHYGSLHGQDEINHVQD